MDMFDRTFITRRPVLAGLIAVLLAVCLGAPTAAQSGDFEEIVVNFDVPRLVNSDIFVQYDGATIYLPLVEIFTLLELNVNNDQLARRIYGFLTSDDDGYEIDVERGTVVTPQGSFELARDSYLYSGYEFFLRTDLFETYFGLATKFDFSQLKVSIPLDQDFPAYQRLKRRRAQEKLMLQREDEKDIYPLPFRRAYLQGGVADWMISTNPIGSRRTQYFSLNTGSMLMGGDLTVSGTGNTRTGFDANDIRYKWHYFVDDSPYLSQVDIGNVFMGGRLARSLDGVFLTNKPQVRRKYFQTLNLSGHIGEGWEVELYIDNRLTDFVRTDQRGIYEFNVDIYYGASLIVLKMYGPNGEIKTEETNVKVPYNLIPQGEVEYGLSVGRDDNPYASGIYGQASCTYGLTSQLTASLSADMPIDVAADTSRPMFAGELSFQPLTNLTMNGFVSPDNAVVGGLNFTQPSLININANYTKYLTTGYRNLAGREHTVSFSVSSPLRIGSRRLGLRCNAYIDKYPTKTDLNAYYGFGTSLNHFYINYFGQYKSSRHIDNRPRISSIASQLMVSTTFLRWIRPQVRFDYDHTNSRIIKYGIYLTKRIFKTGQVTLSLERNAISKTDLAVLSFTLYSDFAGFTSRMVTSGDQVAVTQTQRGSIRYNPEIGSIHFDRRSGVGQGSAVLRPFIDKNFNGVLDDEDETVPGLTAKIKGASGRLTGDNQVFYFDRLRAYDEYIIEINEYSLDDPTLKPLHEAYRMNFNPNMVTAVDIPIVYAGEISGMVKRVTENGESGLGGARIVLINLSSGSKSEIVTFNNGEFYHLGLTPGRYRAQPDPEQMDRYGYQCDPQFIDFEVEPVEGGSVVEDINFLLLPR